MSIKIEVTSMKKLYVFSEKDFVESQENQCWSYEEDVPERVAIISIDNRSNPWHYYKKGSENILNVDFDDISDYTDGCMFGLDDDQAETIVRFILKNIDCDFYIHCNAGRSRSQGVARFILDCIPGPWETRRANPCNTPNYHVVVTLKRAYRNIVEV